MRLGFMVLLLVLALPPAWAQSSGDNNLADLDLEQLMHYQVSSVSKKDQDLSNSAAAVYVITQEDIRRSGATSLPDALRLAPGLQVNRIDAQNWAIGARGFNAPFSNKLLVLVDGRSIYSPVSSGVMWGLEEIPIDDVDHIEVIRGPGAAMWGSNAVNGVINIITKRAEQTAGLLIDSQAGTQDQFRTDVRYGGRLGTNMFYRVFSQFDQTSEFQKPDFPQTGFGRTSQGGFRLDGRFDEENEFTVEGGLSSTHQDMAFNAVSLAPPYGFNIQAPVSTLGGNVLAKWKRRYNNGAESTLQFFHDYADQNSVYPSFASFRNAFTTMTDDADFRYARPFGSRQQISLEAEDRCTNIHDEFVDMTGLHPTASRSNAVSGNVQDDVELAYDHLFLTVAARVESSTFYGNNAQPTARLLWAPNRNHSFWTALSEANRVPSLEERSFSLDINAFPSPSGMQVLRLLGTKQVQSERVRASEFGYRWQAARRLLIDASLFDNRYRHMAYTVPSMPEAVGAGQDHYLLIPLNIEYLSRATSQGGELSARFDVSRWWRLSGSYSYLALRPNVVDPAPMGLLPGNDHQHLFQIHSQTDLSRHWELDAHYYYYGALPRFNYPLPGGWPEFDRLDIRLGRRLGEQGNISVIGQNLLRPRQMESLAQTVVNEEIPRSVSIRLTLQF